MAEKSFKGARGLLEVIASICTLMIAGGVILFIGAIALSPRDAPFWIMLGGTLAVSGLTTMAVCKVGDAIVDQAITSRETLRHLQAVTAHLGLAVLDEVERPTKDGKKARAKDPAGAEA